MSTRRFRRHAPPCLDAAIHRIFVTLTARPALRGAFTRLLTIVRARSALLRDLPPSPRYPQLEALRNLADHHRRFVADPFAWTGADGRHPLAIVDSLARHLLGRYPGPRFLASVWFGGDSDEARVRRGWYIEHSRGRSLRRLRLPVVLTRRMEHVLLHSPDHLELEPALRRAEVIGLGGSPALAAAVVATRLGTSFDRPELWRGVIEWLVACDDEVDLDRVKPIIDDVQAAATPPELRGRPFDAIRREVEARAPRWQPARPVGPVPGPRAPEVWARSPWREGTFGEADERWRMVELTDSTALVAEGRALHHCVAIYASRCASGSSRIWSLRRTSCVPEEPVLTIEVDPKAGAIVQIRGTRNQRATGRPLAVVRQWAARERIAFAPAVEAELAALAAAAALAAMAPPPTAAGPRA